MIVGKAHYDRIVAPVITEKATLLLENNKIVFKTDKRATKPQIKKAIEALFGVEVIAVNTLVQPGKVKRFRGRVGRRPGCKKAIVTLKEGQSIDIASGLQVK